MGKDKLLLEYRSKSLIQHAVDLLSGLPVYERIVVTSHTRSKLITLLTSTNLLVNEAPEIGISESIYIGIASAAGTHYLFLTADQPRLTVEDIMPLIEAAGANTEKIIFPEIDSKPCSPTIFPEHFRQELLKLRGGDGGRVVRDSNREHCMAIKPDCPMNFIDVDNMEDYHGLLNR